MIWGYHYFRKHPYDHIWSQLKTSSNLAFSCEPRNPRNGLALSSCWDWRPKLSGLVRSQEGDSHQANARGGVEYVECFEYVELYIIYIYIYIYYIYIYVRIYIHIYEMLEYQKHNVFELILICILKYWYSKYIPSFCRRRTFLNLVKVDQLIGWIDLKLWDIVVDGILGCEP